MNVERAEVLIAGAGPVGTVVAGYLAQHGIDVILAEALPTWAKDLRASTFHPPTLEILDELGAVDAMIEQGLICPVYQYRDRRSPHVFSWDLTELADMTRFPYRLQCEQFKLTRHLCKQFENDPCIRVLYSHKAVGVTQDDDAATVQVQTDSGMRSIQAQYVVAADGADSAIRAALDVELEGFTYPEKFVTLSTTYPVEQHFDDLAYINYIADPARWVLFLRTPDFWRVLVRAPDAAGDDYLLSDEFKNLVFQDVLDTDSVETNHRAIYAVHQRVARQYRVGRVLLAGDSAHLNNPLGGFGMNSGIHDGWNLAEKLVRILRGGENENLLDLYEKQRRTVTRDFIQRQSIKNKEMMETKDDAGLAAQRAEFERINADDKLRRKYLLDQALFTTLEDAARITS